MRSTTTALAFAATLMAAPLAMAQGQQQPQQGTVGSPAAPGGGGSSMTQGTPGTATTPRTTPGTTNAPGMAPPPVGDTPRTERTDRGANPDAVGTNRPPTTTTPAAGANSFTEGQARDRIAAAGYSDVQNLKKDDKGVWRGQAMQNGQRVDVGLDFKGQVVTGNAPAQ
ncbi:MAG TPA: hypothetical protein VNZ61_07510 [Roseomonas sp.]|nr:hypothetical protein [Roseomonas sp.]